jgi:tetratricopeptide (TPR) repeat protein
VEIDIKAALKYLEEGKIQYKKCNYMQALELFSRSIDLNSGCCEAFFFRGRVKSDLGEYGEAILDFNEAIRLDPGFKPAYENRGMIKANLGDYLGAWQDIGIMNG